jgi:prepilin-type N-terminal cleavage/methylation domain-containing protein
MNMKKVLKKMGNQGFTLMEVMIAAGLIGVVSLTLVNQLNLVNKAKRESNSSTIINGITDKLMMELSHKDTCGANFAGKIISAAPLTIIGAILDTEGAPIVQNGGNYGLQVGGNNVAAASGDTVRVNAPITIVRNVNNPDEMILKVEFEKKTLFGLYTSAGNIEIPITAIQNAAGAIQQCFNDISNSISTAIRLSCQGNTAYFNPRANNGYGACEHNLQTNNITCPNGKFIKKIQYFSSLLPLINEIRYTCIAPEATCPPNQVLTSFLADGTYTCAPPFPNCTPGQIMVKGAAGSYYCINLAPFPGGLGCTGITAIKSFNADGSVTCAQYYPPQSCPGAFVKGTIPGAIACDDYIHPINCPPGQFISSFNASGFPICTKFINYPFNCPAGQGAYGVDAAGNLRCKNFERRLSCNGAYSPMGYTFTDCVNAGGVVQNRDFGTNSFCRLPGGTCPGGSSICPTWRKTVNISCTDTKSICSQSVQTRWKIGSNVFTTPVFPQTAVCFYWKRISGPYPFNTGPCSINPGPTATTPVTEIGCY